MGKIQAREWINGFTINNFGMGDFANNPPALPTEKSYPSGKVPINRKKIADLKKLEKYVIWYEDFYGKIFKWSTPKQMTALRMLKSRKYIYFYSVSRKFIRGIFDELSKQRVRASLLIDTYLCMYDTSLSLLIINQILPIF